MLTSCFLVSMSFLGKFQCEGVQNSLPTKRLALKKNFYISTSASSFVGREEGNWSYNNEILLYTVEEGKKE